MKKLYEKNELTFAIVCIVVYCALQSLGDDSPMGFGRNGERVAKTPIRSFPPNLGGRTVGDQELRAVLEKTQISQR